jgi:hypothetical protein
MSFFSSLVANVTSGVANLGLSSRRFSLSRQDSNETNVTDSNTKIATTPSITVTSSSNLSTQHGKHSSFIYYRMFLSIFLPAPSLSLSLLLLLLLLLLSEQDEKKHIYRVCLRGLPQCQRDGKFN